MRAAGFAAKQGGRFLTFSRGASKADHLTTIAGRLGCGRIAALGDAPNDAEMIEAADFGVIVANPDGADIPRLAGEADGRIRRSTQHGPDGWNTEMTRLLDQLGFDE